MILEVPMEATKEIMRYEATAKILKLLSSNAELSASSVMRKANVSWKAAWTTLHALTKADLLEKRGNNFASTYKVKEHAVQLNLRDSLTDVLFKWRCMRRLLYELYRHPDQSLSEVSHKIGVHRKTVECALKALRRSGVVEGKSIKSELISMPSDPLDLVPRKVHKQVLGHFLAALKTYYAAFDEALVLYGDASWGRPTFKFDVLAVLDTIESPKIVYIAEKLALAARNTTSNFGVSFDLTLTNSYIWPQLSLGLVEGLDQRVSSMAEGLCICGELPHDDDFFILGRKLNPLSLEKTEELLKKRYIAPANSGKYVYTKKAIRKFREKKSKMIEEPLLVGGRKMSLLSVIPPT